MGVRQAVIWTLLMGCLVAGKPLASETGSETAPSVKMDEISQPEAREEPSPISSDPSFRQYGVAIPDLKHTQFQTSDDSGRYSFGYAYPEQVHMETRSEDGLVRGSYYYKDPNGKSNQVQYLADGDGFRVSANNLPVFVPGEQPEPVRDTPEVEEAKRKHLETWDAIAKHNEQQSAKNAVQQRTSSNDDQVQGEIPLANEEITVVDLVPVATQPASAKVARNQPFIKPFLDTDVVIDEEKQAIITEQDEASDPSDSAFIEIDAEPIKLLAQLYAKHVKDNSEPLQPIERPAGFHPQNLQPSGGFDLFSRSEGDDAIEVINPEFVDLRAFLLTNRFRDGQQLVIRTEDKPNGASVNEYTPYQEDPSSFPTGFPQELFNYYYNMPYNRPVPITRETLDKLPESLKVAIEGNVAPDGQHTAQVAPQQYQKIREQEMMQRFVAPYAPFYSPYHLYRNAALSYYNPYAHPYPYYNAPVTPYLDMPFYHPYYSY